MSLIPHATSLLFGAIVAGCLLLTGCDSKPAAIPTVTESPRQAFEAMQAALKAFDKPALHDRIAPASVSPEDGTRRDVAAEVVESMMAERPAWLQNQVSRIGESGDFAVLVLENPERELTFVRIGGRWLLGTRPFFRQLSASEKEQIKAAERAMAPVAGAPSPGDSKKEEALRMTRLLAAAIRGYYAEYGRLPILPPTVEPDVEGGDAEVSLRDLLPILTGQDAGPNEAHKWNPRKAAFLSLPQLKLTDGTLLDPWGQEYNVMLSLDGDQHLTIGGTPLDSVVAVWSCGPNRACQLGRHDDIAAWK